MDFDALENLEELNNNKIGAICCSRPTNPTGNVLTDGEMAHLKQLAKKHGIPLIIDNAYDAPFPNIIHTSTTLEWDDETILCFGLSKIGLPGVRTGIIIAHPKVTKAVSNMNAIVNLSPVRFGAAIATPLFENDEIICLSDELISPFYKKQSILLSVASKKNLQIILFISISLKARFFCGCGLRAYRFLRPRCIRF